MKIQLVFQHINWGFYFLNTFRVQNFLKAFLFPAALDTFNVLNLTVLERGLHSPTVATSPTWTSLQKQTKILSFHTLYQTGSLLEWVQRVLLQRSILGKRCMYPSIIRAAITTFCLFFLFNCHILHPSIEISIKGTVYQTTEITPGGALDSLTIGGAKSSELIEFAIFIQ